jgi:putative transposase
VRFSFIAAHRDVWPVRVQCRVLGVSASGYYAWRRGTPSARSQADAQLLARIEVVHRGSRQLYGSPRIHGALCSAGVRCSRKRVARLMRCAGIRGRTPRSFVVTTQPGGAYSAAANLLQRRFAPGTVEALASDITALPTAEGFLYLAVVLSIRTRAVLGFAFSDRLHGGLGLEALQMALERSPQPAGTLHHSDRGGHYASHAFQALLLRHQLVASMSRAGDCWDNAVAESFFATLKRELGQPRLRPTRAETAQQVFEYIEVFYNRRRLHSSLGYETPEAYGKLIAKASSCVH